MFMYAGATITSYQACTQLEDFLLSRITKSNHNIKYKCLQIIKVITYYYYYFSKMLSTTIIIIFLFDITFCYYLGSMFVEVVVLNSNVIWVALQDRSKTAFVSSLHCCYYYIQVIHHVSYLLIEYRVQRTS